MEIGRTASSDQQIMDRSHEVSLDINEIATLRDKLKTKVVFSSKCCIYRVPDRLRELNEKVCAPRVASIGPINHGKKNLKALEEHKIMYLQQFLEQSSSSVEDLINIVKDKETDLRDCYSETIDLTSEGFTAMILLDAVFVITILLKFNCVGESHDSGSGDHIFFRPFKINDVMWDMCLLENQLPFFILEEFFKRYSEAGANPKNYTVIELTSLLFSRIMDEWVKEDSWKTIDSSEVLHFVDFIRKCQQPTERSSEEREIAILTAPTATEWSCEDSDILITPTATELHHSGVKFEHRGRNSLLDVTFSNGTLVIPQLIIHARTETLFRNLQAFELCHHMYDEERFVGDYIFFITCLVRTPNDVELLARKENLKNLLDSDEEVSNFLHKLKQENFASVDSIFSGVSKDLNSHCEKPWHQWKANLKQDYFKNPWTAISVAAAAFLLILTVIQTVFSILK